ncbi:hypothetical protein CDD83_8585 [Cordyceps sp. RAO-2017]|nr:hypothetical protein CDD83_8585 [Cordyceps sp. RAO-2017]
MSVPVEEILEHYEYDPQRVERVATRRVPQSLEIVEPDADWPRRFDEVRARIEAALGPTAVAVAHAGSTSVPGLPAKDCIDVDLTVPDARDEAAYVAPREAAGLQFLLREPAWHQHRFFCQDRPYAVNLHVWGPACPEVERHRIFRDWLRREPAERALYARAKREASEAAARADESVMDYNLRKERTIRDILHRAFRDLGYLD